MSIERIEFNFLVFTTKDSICEVDYCLFIESRLYNCYTFAHSTDSAPTTDTVFCFGFKPNEKSAKEKPELSVKAWSLWTTTLAAKTR